MKVAVSPAILFGTVVLAGLFGMASSSNYGGELKKQLAGTWRVVSIDTRSDAHGAWKPEYGAHPTGYIQYGADGRMSVQFCADPPTKKFASGDDENPTLEEAKGAYLNYVAYFGTYTVDEKRHVVTHHVQSSLWPSYTATDQVRPFVIDGDKFEIRIANDSGAEWRRVFERVE